MTWKGVNVGEINQTVRDKCVLTCHDFLKEELPELANRYLARYLSSLIEEELPEDSRTLRGECRVVEECDPHQCVRVLTSGEQEHSMVMLGLNMSRERVAEAIERLRGSKAKERLLVYMYSFEGVGDEDTISQALMEQELLQMVRNTGIIAFFAMLDIRAGMGMLARIDGDRRLIQYLPH